MISHLALENKDHEELSIELVKGGVDFDAGVSSIRVDTSDLKTLIETLKGFEEELRDPRSKYKGA